MCTIAHTGIKQEHRELCAADLLSDCAMCVNGGVADVASLSSAVVRAVRSWQCSIVAVPVLCSAA
eukprot:5437722-Alexandrium_andersonii.AAC.1